MPGAFVREVFDAHTFDVEDWDQTAPQPEVWTAKPKQAEVWTVVRED